MRLEGIWPALATPLNEDETIDDVDTLIWAIGRRPNTDRIGIEHTGLELNANGTITVDHFQQTSVAGVYAIAPLAKAALEKGKHVLVEKPIAIWSTKTSRPSSSATRRSALSGCRKSRQSGSSGSTMSRYTKPDSRRCTTHLPRGNLPAR